MAHTRIAIVGTAQTWTQTPWADPGLRIWSLNDAWRLKGFTRADAWFDFHPPDKWWAPPVDGQVFAHQVPAGHYCRPKDHAAWLLTQMATIPVYLHPSYPTVWPAAAGMVNAKPFPKAEIEAYFGRYFTSSPAWMLALAVMQGCRDLSIYGIHLATEHEYIEQRPNFEFLIGRVLGPEKTSITTVKGMRTFETSAGRVTLPEAAPILASDFQYAFEPRPRQALDPLKWEQHKIQVKRERALQTLRTAKPWTRIKPVQQDLIRLDAWAADVQEQMQRLQAQQAMGG